MWRAAVRREGAGKEGASSYETPHVANVSPAGTQSESRDAVDIAFKEPFWDTDDFREQTFH